MQITNTTHKYGWMAQVLHWSMALLIIFLLALGLYMVPLPLNALKLKLYGWHKEWGIVVLMLVVFRLLWRLSTFQPPYPSHMPTWQKWAASSVHFAFYLLMIAMPLSGWLLSSASGLPVSFFGWFVLPDLISGNEQSRYLLTEVHKWLGYAFIAAICGHVGAALQHHFIDKDDILRRMLP